MKTNRDYSLNRISKKVKIIYFLTTFQIFGLNCIKAQITALSIPTFTTINENVGSYDGSTWYFTSYWYQLVSPGRVTGNQSGTNQATGTIAGWYGSGVANNGGMSFLGSNTITIGCGTLVLQNNTGKTITGFTLSFLAKMFNSGSASPKVKVYYYIGSGSSTPTRISAGPLNDSLTSLFFSDATPNISNGTTLSQTVTSISIPNGSFIQIRWLHESERNSDNLGWNNIKFIPIGSATITSSLTTLPSYNTTFGTPSNWEKFFLQAFDLSLGVSIKPPIGFEASTNSSFSNVGTNDTSTFCSKF
jgi:hypothetical protein